MFCLEEGDDLTLGKGEGPTTSKGLFAGLFSDSLYFSRDDSWPGKSGLLMEIKKKLIY